MKNHTKIKKNLKLFFQVNTSAEGEKSGVDSYDDLHGLVQKTLDSNSKKIKIAGLMTIGTIRTDKFEQEARRCFSQLLDYKLKLEDEFSDLKLSLSMGMSADYKIALEYKTDFIRVGSAIFKN